MICWGDARGCGGCERTRCRFSRKAPQKLSCRVVARLSYSWNYICLSGLQPSKEVFCQAFFQKSGNRVLASPASPVLPDKSQFENTLNITRFKISYSKVDYHSVALRAFSAVYFKECIVDRLGNIRGGGLSVFIVKIRVCGKLVLN